MKMGSKSSNHMVDVLFTLALFCVFAASALMVVLIGANVYKNTVSNMDASFSGRTSLTYVANKVRQNDSLGSIHMENMQGVSALVLDQQVGEETYQTWIYHYAGTLRESFVVQGTEFDPNLGQVILEVPDFRVQESNQMLLLTAVDEDGRLTSQWIAPRCGL